jgi:hypothetical protein
LSDDELRLAELLATLINAVGEVQAAAAAVRESGGDCKAAFMSVIPADARGAMELQWPVISMMLGV